MPRRKPSRPSLAGCLSPDFFRALADPNRVAILARLARASRPRTVSDIARHLPIDFSVVSRHLKILRAAGILETEKRGKHVLYRVRISYLVNSLRNLADALQECCPDDAHAAPKDITLSKGGPRS